MSDLNLRLYNAERQLDRLYAQDTGPSLGQLVGHYLALPELRGFWPFSSMNESGNAIDMAGQGRTLTNNASISRNTLSSGLPYSALNGSTQYWSRASEAGLQITGPLTVGAWVYFYNSGSAQETMMAKSDGTGGANDAWYLARNPDGTVRWYVASGPGYQSLISTQVLARATWYHIVAGFTPSSTLRIYVNGMLNRQIGTSYASINSNAAPLNLGAFNNAGLLMSGWMALPFVCATAVPDNTISTLYKMGRIFFGV